MFESVIGPFRDRILEAGVERLGIFGSVVRGEARDDSDVDALVIFKPHAKKLDNLLIVGDALEQAFKRRVDIVTGDSISPLLKPHIEREVKYVDLSDRIHPSY